MDEFGVEHHAMLFAWVAQEAVGRFGDDGKRVILEGVRVYGEQRGRRMRLRARADGHPNDLVGYLLYGELNFGEAENEFVRVQEEPYLKVQAQRCSWHDTWSERGVLEYGRLYCQEIDTAILRGYNPDFGFDVDGTLSGGADCCTFHYRGGRMGVWNKLRYLFGKRRVGQRAVQPWEYHAGHLYKTLEERLVAAFGEEGERAATAALQTFGQVYGGEMARVVRGFESVDFDQIS